MVMIRSLRNAVLNRKTPPRTVDDMEEPEDDEDEASEDEKESSDEKADEIVEPVSKPIDSADQYVITRFACESISLTAILLETQAGWHARRSIDHPTVIVSDSISACIPRPSITTLSLTYQSRRQLLPLRFAGHEE